MIGQTLGHYRNLERIGAGGMGEVYRARDERLERDVAIKILSTESIGDLEAGKRLRREAQSASALNDPHICTIYEVGEANGRAFIVMELVEGRALNSLIPPEGLQFWALWQVLSELYRTMALVAVLSGMRSGEIFGLRWRYVDFEERSILVAETVYRGRSSMPKTRASNRKVFIQDLALEVLKRLKSSGGGPDDFVFCTSKGTPFNPNNVRGRVLIPACSRAGIPLIGWHDMRQTFATWSNPTGESLKALQTQLGHTNPRLALDVYTQPMPEAQRQLAVKVARVLLPVCSQIRHPGK